MEWIFVAGVLVYIVLGILVGGGKADLFMGLFVYNYKETAHMYDKELLQPFLIRICIYCAASFLVMFLGVVVDFSLITWVGIALLFFVMSYAIGGTKKDNFKKPEYRTESTVTEGE